MDEEEPSEEELEALKKWGSSLSEADIPDRSKARVVRDDDLDGDDGETAADLRFSNMTLFHPPTGQPECGSARATSVYNDYIQGRAEQDEFFAQAVREVCGLRIYCECGTKRCCAGRLATIANKWA